MDLDRFDQSYVVRIYRREALPTARDMNDMVLAGVVENPHTGDYRTFHSMAELWQVLATPAQAPVE